MDSLMVLLAPAGVAFLVLLTWVLGGNKTAALADTDAALERFRQDFFDFQASDIVLSEQGRHAALLVPATGAGLGLVFAIGDNYATRHLQAGDVSKLAVDGTAVIFRINEFTGRKIRFACDSEDHAQQIAARLQPLQAA